MRMNGSITLVLLSTLTLVATAQATGVMTATADNRAGDIHAYINHGGDPVEASYNIDPGSNEWMPITFNQTVNDSSGGNTASAMLNTHSSFVGINSGTHVFTSLSAISSSNATLHILSGGPNGFAQSHDRVSMGFTISGLTGAQRLYVRFEGTATASGGATATVHLIGPGHNHVFTAGAFNQVYGLRNGTYDFLAETNIQYTSSVAINASGTASYNISMSPTTAGDLDCDGIIGFSDIDYIVAAIPDNQTALRALFASRHGGGQPSCPFTNCDINADGHVNFADIDPFVDALTNQ